MLKNCVLQTTMVDPCDPALEVLRQEVHQEFQANTGYTVRLCLQTNGRGGRRNGGREVRKKREGEEGKKARMWVTPTRT